MGPCGHRLATVPAQLPRDSQVPDTRSHLSDATTLSSRRGVPTRHTHGLLLKEECKGKPAMPGRPAPPLGCMGLSSGVGPSSSLRQWFITFVATSLIAHPQEATTSATGPALAF